MGVCEAHDRCYAVASNSVRLCASGRATAKLTASEKGEVFVEFVVQGNVVKATAIDAATGTEASIVGPASAGRQALAQAAARKLQYVLTKKA